MRFEFLSRTGLGLSLLLTLPVQAELLPLPDTVLVSQDGRVAAYDKAHHLRLWQTRVAGRLTGPLPVMLSKTGAVGLDVATGRETWSHTVAAPWYAPQRLGDLIVAGPAGQLLAWRADTGAIAWELPLVKPLAVEASPDGQWLAVRCEGEFLVMNLQGQVAWRKPVVAKEGTLGPWWSPDSKLVGLRNGMVWVILDAATGALGRPTDVTWLDRHAEEAGVTRIDLPDTGTTLFGQKEDGSYVRRELGQLGRWTPIPGQPLGQVGNLLLLNAGMPMPDMQMDRHGTVILDPKTRMPKPRFVDGYIALQVPELRPIEGSPRGAVVGTRTTWKDWALYTIQEDAAQPQGKPKPPAPDPVLHARSATGTWTHAGPFRPEWELLEDRIYLAEGDRLLTLDPATGQTLWTSPPLELGEGAPQLKKDGDLLLVQTAAGFYYTLNASTGQLLGANDIREHFIAARGHHLLALFALCCAIAGFIAAARRRDLFIRPIAGLKAIDNAVGRATEMGQPVLYVPGLEDVDDIQTLASLSILRHVARKTAEYDTDILVPTRRAVVMSTAQEVVKEAYTQAGRPDSYHAENIRYLTDDQFGYVVGVDGMMLRERPAANFFLGMFYAESLILAETGHATGAIQIAGTAAPSQLPFFVAACDYTLIGEELYAASAYLSKDPLQIGSLRGQDVGKALVMLAILVGAVLLSLGYDGVKVWFAA